MTTGVFLTPGAARGAYQAGALQVLVAEAGIHFDVIAATSVGALNGALVATGQVDAMVAEWSRWKTSDVVRVDVGGLLRRGIWWAPSLMSNQPEQEVIHRHLDGARLLDGVRLRIALANLDTANLEHFQWPGASLDLAEAVIASVAVPVAAAPSRLAGTQWADGLTVDGFPLEALLLETGVDRAFVVGVAPRRSAEVAHRDPVRAALRAADWNQYSETLLGLERAGSTDERVRAWMGRRQGILAAIEASGADADEKSRVAAEVEAAFADADFPVTRGPVEVVSILPETETAMFLGSFRPRRSRALMEQGRADARRALESLA